jgi:hypothetical protein
MPDANTFASIGFTNVSDHFARPYPESAIPTDDWPFFYMVERAYPFTMMQLALSCVVLTIPLFFARHHLLQPDRRGQDQHLDGVRLQSDGRAVRRGDGIQFHVFRICVPLSARAGILCPGMGVFMENRVTRSGRDPDHAEQ